VPEALEASGPVPPAAAAKDEAGTAAVTAGTAGSASGAAAAGTGTEAGCCCQTQLEPSSSSCPQSPALALGVEGSVNQLVEVVEAVVHERVLQVVIESLLEALLLIAIIGDLSGGIASELEETITVLGHRHSSLK
jgi:hypothetical protein